MRFDAYVTLFDINSVTKHYCNELGDITESFSNLWRSKQLEYSWLCSLMNRYEDFWCITEESLDYALYYFNIKSELLKNNFLKSYENIGCYEEIPTILSKLKERGLSTAILSNASPNLLHMAIKNSKIDSHIDSCLSVDSLKTYKPHPTVYNLILEKYYLNKNEILFVSSNSFDVAGAKSFGFNVSWINRFNNKKEALQFESDIELKSLMDLPNIL